MKQSLRRPRSTTLRRPSVGSILSLLLLVSIKYIAAWTASTCSLAYRDNVLVDSMTSDFPATTNEYMTKRTVSIRSVDWCGSKGMIPLQKYHGPRLSPQNSSHDIHQVDLNNNLSMSSQILSSNLHSLTTEQQHVLQKKIKAEARASQPLNAETHLHILYRDCDIVVVHKPSGVLCVPGPRRNPSLANLVHETLHVEIDVDKTVVHRLDMDTSGIVVFALNKDALSVLHDDFRKGRVKKTYQALVCGHVPAPEVEIDLSLERDPHHPPFMRVTQTKVKATHVNNAPALSMKAVHKFLNQSPKPSLTHVRVLSYEYLNGNLPVTRLELRPQTGRTHQLRVHCAAMGHCIVGDDIYGYRGEGAPNGGLDLQAAAVSREVQEKLYSLNNNLCLHAQQLCILHPRTRTPMIFEADASF